MSLAQLIADVGLAASKGEAKRLIQQGGVKVNGEKATAAAADVDISGAGMLLQVGKLKFLKDRWKVIPQERERYVRLTGLPRG